MPRSLEHLDDSLTNY